MLNKLGTHFFANKVAVDRAPDRSSYKPPSDTTPLLFSATPPKKSSSRLSNDAGNDDTCAPTNQSFKLRFEKNPRQLEKYIDALPSSLKSTKQIRDESKQYYQAMTETEISFASENTRTTRKKTTMETLLEGSDFAGMIDKKTGGFLDPNTGLCCQLQRLDSENYALCIPGIAPGKTFGTQLSASIQQFLGVGGVPEIYSQALKLAQFLNGKLEQGGKKLELSGHSMGGGIANYVGLKLDLPSVCFNAAVLGRACLKDIGEVSQETLKKQIHIRMENDFATHPPVTRKLQAFFYLGREKYIPRNVGIICEIKSSDPFYPSNRGIMDRHLLDAMDDWYKQLHFSRMFG
jgi:hypothetical protein